ncbi:PorT family protein, partial [Brachyspira catarrhinii]
QLGYMIGITDGLGISILGEIGYAHDTFAFSIDGSAMEAGNGAPRMTLSQSFESIQIGLLPKVNIGAFAIGIGGGVKIPMASTINVKYGDTDAGSLKLNMNDIGTMYSTALIGYIKGTFDYSIF